MIGIDASAVSSVVGVQTRYVDLSGGAAKYLPQRIAVFAQGNTGVSYPTTKWTAPGANETGARFGYGSPAHKIMQQLKPVFGGGVGTVPVDIFPLVDANGSAASEGQVVPSGTGTVAAERRLRIGGVLSNAFVIGAVAMATAAELTKACAAIGDAVSAVLDMPVNVTYDYGTVTSAPGTNTGNGTCTALSVVAGQSPRPGNWTLKCVTAVADGGVFSLTDPKGTVVNAALTMTPGAGGATVFNTNTGGLQFTLTDASTDFAVNDTFTITVPATGVNFVSKWKGASANGIVIELVEAAFAGISFAITQPTGGLANPSLSEQLASIGGVWYTLGLNALEITDTTALDAIKDWGEPRWLPVMSKPIVVFTGNTIADRATNNAISAARQSDRVNGQLVSPGSPTLPFVVAAAQLAHIALTANNRPAVGYKANQCPGIIPGTDAQQWDYNAREAAVLAGSSTVEVIDNVVQIGDVVTFYRPTGEVPPGFNYVVNIVKLQNAIFNFRLEFEKKEWAAAPIVDDADVVDLPEARRPRDFKTTANNILKGLGRAAIITRVAAAQKKTKAVVDSQNPNRVNIEVVFPLSGNSRVKDIDIAFGFAFGGAEAA